MSLKEKVVSGIKWSVTTKLIVQVFSWITTFLVIRILVPEDYAIMALLSIATSFVSLFALNGFSAVIIRGQTNCKQLEQQVFTVSLLIHIVYSMLIYFFARSIGDFFDNSQLTDVVQIYAFLLPINAMLIVPFARIDIKMNFKVRGIIESISAFLSSITCLFLAYSGYGFWSLIWAQIIDMVLKVVLFSFVTKTMPRVTNSFKGAKDWIAFLIKLQINSLLWFSYSKLDTVIIGRLIGMKELGIYNVGVQVASLPATKFSSVINQVGFSAFSSVNNDLEAGRRYLVKSIRITSFLLFPVFLGISSIADPLVEVLMGDKWLNAAPIIAIFSFIFPFRMINTIIQNYLNSIGLAGANLKNTLLTFFILTISIGCGSFYGVNGVAFAWLIGYSLSFILILVKVSLIINIQLRELISWVPAFTTSLGMWLLIYMCEPIFELFGNLFTILLMKIVVGIFIVATVFFLFFKRDIEALIDLKNN
jgi:O-antigen/teichoic acid export membrane protein